MAAAESEGPTSSKLASAEFARVPDPSIPGGLTLGEGHLTLLAENNALLDDGIQQGDMIVLEARQTVADGETVVALVNGTTTVRKLFHEANGRLRLEAQSKNLAPICAGEAEVEIRGRVIALVRKYQSSNP